MRAKYAVRHVDDVAVLDLSGHLSPGNTIEDRLVLHDLVSEQLRSGRNKILLNMAEVTFIDSSGLGDLIGAVRFVQSQGGQMHICSATPRINDLLYRTHLDSIIQCFVDEDTARSALSAQGQATPPSAA